MSASLPSEEVADDYRNSLEDLITNDRYQISTLTLIAKENIEHAEAISRVLQNHIQRVPPPRKLPALYVLDSIVKNVGTPYTVYFGRNLHTIFIHAYSQVDGPVRRKLEEMLKTWREPVPGSLSTTPVFPISTTQSLVDTLNRFRAATPQGRVQPGPPGRVGSAQPFRDTPTPPQNNAQYAQPAFQNPQHLPQNGGNVYHQQQNHPQYLQSSHTPYQIPAHPPPQTPSHPPSGYQSPRPVSQNIPALYFQPPPASQRPSSAGAVDMAKLHDDIDDLTTDAKIECATHPMDQSAQTKLASLQSLKEILDSGALTDKDLLDIRNSILQQKAEKLRLSRPPPPAPSHLPIIPTPPSYATPKPAHYLPPSSTPSFVNSTNLAELLQATSRNQPSQAAYGAPFATHAQAMNTPPVHHAEPALPAAELPLLAQLRASGLLSANPTPPPSLTPVMRPLDVTQPAANPMGEVQFTSASIKTPRPQTITTFLNTRPNQCTTCGRRFTSDEVGKEKKSRHLDWHFKTKARMTEAEHRTQNRSWYVDEREWIASKEYEDDAAPVDEVRTDTNGSSSLGAKKAIQDYVRAPADPFLRNAPCPIDQETFKSEWSEELQDFIWKDAIQVGGRYYHASCYKEATRDRDRDFGGMTPLGAGTGRTSTPDSVLGKRKAEQDDLESGKSKIKFEIS